jgi:hypothetical protein
VPLKPEIVDGGAKLRVVVVPADVVVPLEFATVPVDVGVAKLTIVVFEVPGEATVIVVVVGLLTVTVVLPVAGVVVGLAPPAGLKVEAVSRAVCADALNPAKRTATPIAGIARVLMFTLHLLGGI